LQAHDSFVSALEEKRPTNEIRKVEQLNKTEIEDKHSDMTGSTGLPDDKINTNMEVESYLERIEKRVNTPEQERINNLLETFTELSADYKRKILSLEKLIKKFENDNQSLIANPEFIVNVQTDNLKLYLQVDKLNLELVDWKTKENELLKTIEELREKNINLESAIRGEEAKLYKQASNLNKALNLIACQDLDSEDTPHSSAELLEIDMEMFDLESPIDSEGSDDEAENMLKEKLRNINADFQDEESDPSILNNLEYTIKSLTHQRDSLTNKIEKNNESRERQRKVNEHLKYQILALQEEHREYIEQFEKHNNELREQLSDSNHNNDTLNKQLKTAIADVHSLESENTEFRENEKISRETSKNLTRKMKILQEEYKETKRNYDSISENHEKLTQSSKTVERDLRSKYKTTLQQLNHLNANVDVMVDQWKAAEEHAGTVTNDKEKLARELEAAKKRDILQKMKLKDMTENAKIREGEIEVLHTQLGHFEEIVSEKRKREEELLSHIRETEEQKLLMTEQFEETTKRLDKLTRAFDGEKKTMDQHQSELEELREKNESMAISLKESESKRELAEHRNQLQRVELDKQNDALGKMNSLYQKLQNEIKYAYTGKKSLEHKCDRYRQRCAELRRDKKHLALSACAEIERLTMIAEKNEQSALSKMVSRLGSVFTGSAPLSPSEYVPNILNILPSELDPEEEVISSVGTEESKSPVNAINPLETEPSLLTNSATTDSAYNPDAILLRTSPETNDLIADLEMKLL